MSHFVEMRRVRRFGSAIGRPDYVPRVLFPVAKSVGGLGPHGVCVRSLFIEHLSLWEVVEEQPRRSRECFPGGVRSLRRVFEGGIVAAFSSLISTFVWAYRVVGSEGNASTPETPYRRPISGVGTSPQALAGGRGAASPTGTCRPGGLGFLDGPFDASTERWEQTRGSRYRPRVVVNL